MTDGNDDLTLFGPRQKLRALADHQRVWWCDTAQTTYPHIDPPHDSCPQCHQPTNGRSRCGIGQAPDEPMIPLSTKAVAKYRKDNPQ